MKWCRILLATDFSPASRAAQEVASRLAHECGAKLLILHVEPGQPTAWMGPAYYDIPDPNISQIARDLVALKPEPPDVDVEHRICAGDAATEILRLAAEESVDLIVVGSRRRNPLQDLLMGSVARAVLHKAPCPVVVCQEKRP